MSGFGVRVSLPGKDALKDPIQDMSLDTSLPLLKLALWGSDTITYTDGGASQSVVIPHNLGYVPRVLVMGQIYDTVSESTAYYMYPNASGRASLVYHTFAYSVDDTNLTVFGESAGGDSAQHTIDFDYYIFYDEG